MPRTAPKSKIPWKRPTPAPPARRPRVVFLICDRVETDEQTGKPNLYGLFDHVRAERFPAPVRGTLWLRVYGGVPSAELRLDLFLPDGTPIPDPPPAIMNGHDGNVEAKQAVGFAVASPGDYTFRVSHDGKTLGEVAIHVFHAAGAAS